MTQTPNPYPEKTARWWFWQYLPEPYKSQAINNFDYEYFIDENGYETTNSLENAISLGFYWGMSIEGRDYWAVIADRISDGEFSTPNPPSPTAEQIASATQSFAGVDTDAYMDEVRGRDNEENTLAKCPECGGLRGGHSNRRCSLMNLEYAQQEIINVEQRWIKIQSETISNWQKDKARLKSKIDFFQSKLAALKHENNQLRRKIKPTP